MVEFFNYLNSQNQLSAEATCALMKFIKAKELRRGQVWLQEGAVCDKMAFIVKGLMKLYFETGSKEVVISLARKNGFMVSTQSFFDQSPSSYIIRCVERTVIVYLQFQELQAIIGKCPELNLHFKLIAQQHIAEHEYHAGLLLLPPKERYLKLVREQSWMVDGENIKDRLLAGYLGIGANVLSAYKNKLL